MIIHVTEHTTRKSNEDIAIQAVIKQQSKY